MIMPQLFAADLSNIYHSKKTETSFTKNELSKLKSMKVLIVPGVLAESFDSNSGNQIKVGFIFEDGFNEQKKLLIKNDIEFEYLNFDTESSIEVNAQAIIAAIAASSKKVVIYSHSKGGLETLEAIRQRPDLLGKIHSWASIQSPFWGSYTASILYGNVFLRTIGRNILDWMGGDIGGMQSLTMEEREVYMAKPEIKSLLVKIKNRIKFLNYGSTKKNLFGIDTPLEFFRDITQIKVGDNDGVVALSSSLMKFHGHNIDFIFEEGVDHLMTMTKYRPESNTSKKRYDQQIHTTAILKMLL